MRGLPASPLFAKPLLSARAPFPSSRPLALRASRPFSLVCLRASAKGPDEMQAFLKRKAPGDGDGGAEPANKAQAARVDAGPITWGVVGKSLIFRDGGEGLVPSAKIAGFDLDGTVVNTKSGETFARGASDWKLFNPHVVPKMRWLVENGYKVVLFSNQASIQSAVTGIKAGQVRARIDAVFKEIGVPAQAFCATQRAPKAPKDDKDPHQFRKPNAGMWRRLEKSFNGGLAVDKRASFYVGDAAGRPKSEGREKDFADTDKGFAASVGIAFLTPEEFFVEGEAPVPKGGGGNEEGGKEGGGGEGGGEGAAA